MMSRVLLRRRGLLVRRWRSRLGPHAAVRAFSVGPGWWSLVEVLLTSLLDAGWDGAVSDVRERHGGLRFSVPTGGMRIFHRIADAEGRSQRTCEACGEPGGPRDAGSARKTLCPSCGDRWVSGVSPVDWAL